MNDSENNNAEVNRRDFLKGSSFATLMAMMGGVPLFAQAPPDMKPEASPIAPKAKIKIAVIGLGPWGREILDQLGRLEQAEVVAICDNYPGAFLKAAKKATGAAKVEDYKAVLANKDIQAIVLATATHQHKDIALGALAAGKHVYCEAPLAHTIEDAKVIALAAKGAVGRVFHSGLQYRCDPQRHWLKPFIRSGALGSPVQARAQWHKKQSWVADSPNEEHKKAINWRLKQSTSLGLAGEIGIHQLDQAGWFFLDALPVAVTGFGSMMLYKDDGRDVADTIQLVLEYPGGARLIYDCTLANSFDTEYEMYYGSVAAVMMRELATGSGTGAWMFKEVDSPLGGWETYARKDSFFKETGIALVAGGSKQTALGAGGAAASAFPFSPLYYALEAFLTNCAETNAVIENYVDSGFDVNDKAALAENLGASLRRTVPADMADTPRAKLSVVQNAPKGDAGFAATVLAIKANEAIVKGQRIELKKEWFELA